MFVACSTQCFTKEPLESALRHIAELEFDKIELAIDDIIPIYLTIAMARTKNVSLINYKNSIKEHVISC